VFYWLSSGGAIFWAHIGGMFWGYKAEMLVLLPCGAACNNAVKHGDGMTIF
jgi:hypothetical protein